MINSTIKQGQSLASTRWHSLKLYNAYRILIAVMLLISQDLVAIDRGWQAFDLQLLFHITFAYLLFSVIAATCTWFEKPKLEIALTAQIVLDVLFIVLIMHAQQIDRASISLLLVIAIASASLISNGRLALFYASIASIGLLIEQTYNTFFLNSNASNYSSAAMLGLACFAIAWLAYSLAKRAQQSEKLASERGLDLKNMSQINALITQAMHDGVLIIGQQYEIKHHNTPSETLLGINHDAWQEKTLTEVAPEIAKLMQSWQSETDSGTNIPNTHIFKTNTNTRELRVSFLPISESRHEGAVVFIEDWSQMQTQAHQVKLAALGRLTANIAHEIRNPLSAISHANQLLQEDEHIDPVNRRMLQIISDNVQRLDQIIKDVLELNRRDRTNQEIITLDYFINEFYIQFCAVEKIQTHHFVLEKPSSAARVVFDRRHLNQILWNLCKNGWRHSQQAQNSLKLTVSQTYNAIQISVIDDGAGITEQVAAHLFEPFFTTENTGTGLGLYIAQELAEANGAKLQFKTSPQGTHFTLLIEKLNENRT